MSDAQHELKRRLVERIQDRAASLGFGFRVKPVASAEPLDPEREAYWMDAALQEAQRLANEQHKGMIAASKAALKPKAQPVPPAAPAPRARVRQAAGVSADEIHNTALRYGITDLQAAEFLKGENR